MNRHPVSLAGVPLIVDGEVRAVIAVARTVCEASTTGPSGRSPASPPIAGGALATVHRISAANQQARLDALTGLPNRRSFDRELTGPGDAARPAACVSVLMVDLDDFKQVNDTFGHVVGDEVLRAVARTISDAVRDTDVAFRFGGEEFSVILRRDRRSRRRVVAERVRVAVEGLTLAWTSRVPGTRFTVSIGVAGGCGPRSPTWSSVPTPPSTRRRPPAATASPSARPST